MIINNKLARNSLLIPNQIKCNEFSGFLRHQTTVQSWTALPTSVLFNSYLPERISGYFRCEFHETWTITNCCLISHIFFVFIAWRDFPAKPSHCYVTHTTNRTERLTRSSLDIETRPPPFGSQSRGTHAEHVIHQLSSCLLKSSYGWTKRCGLLHGRPCVCAVEGFYLLVVGHTVQHWGFLS